MFRTITAYTEEIDDIEVAVAQIKSQIGDRLFSHTVGIIACHYEFVFSGVVEALYKELSFPIVGAITSVQANGAVASPLLLSLTILTSADAFFRVAITDSLLEKPAQAIERAYESANGGERPAMILPFAAFLPQNSGDEYVSTLAKISGDVPCFGTIAVDDTPTFENCCVIYNGGYYHDRMAILLLYGNIHPRFYIATVSEKQVINQPALITSSEGHILKEVNGRPLMEFFEALGLAKSSEIRYALTSLPFMLDYGDGLPLVSKAFITLTEEKQGIFGGAVPEGSTLYIASFDRDDIMLTTGKTVQDALSDLEGASVALIYSCVSRYMTLGANSLDEFEMVKTKIGQKLPFIMACSGGEICPTHTAGEEAKNHFHNNSLVMCVF